MATSSKICTNADIPEHVPDNLKWYEKDGLPGIRKTNIMNF